MYVRNEIKHKVNIFQVTLYTNEGRTFCQFTVIRFELHMLFGH